MLYFGLMDLEALSILIDEECSPNATFPYIHVCDVLPGSEPNHLPEGQSEKKKQN